MRLVYPSDPFNKKLPDENFQEEYEAALAVDLRCALFSFEDFETGDFRSRPILERNELVLYRGWMLDLDVYKQLYDSVLGHGASLLTTPAAYALCHHLPNWYPRCKALTPETIFLHRDADFVQALGGLDWPGYFVKDHVKSLTTTRGSIASSTEEIAQIVDLIEQYRGQIEGGVCVRRLEHFDVATEERYFVIDGRAYSRTDTVPDMVSHLALMIESPFFSIDVVLTHDGTHRLIELGDGQVSDRKLWPADRFVQIFKDMDHR